MRSRCQAALSHGHSPEGSAKEKTRNTGGKTDDVTAQRANPLPPLLK